MIFLLLHDFLDSDLVCKDNIYREYKKQKKQIHQKQKKKELIDENIQKVSKAYLPEFFEKEIHIII